MVDVKGKKSLIIIGMVFNQNMQGDSVNQVKSVYPFDDFEDRMKYAAKNGNLVVLDKEKARTQFASIGITPAELSEWFALSKDSLSQSSENVNPDNAQVSENDAQTDAEIDRKVKNSLGIAELEEVNRSLAAEVTTLQQDKRDLERQIKDYRAQLGAGGAQHVTDIRRTRQVANRLKRNYSSKIDLDTLTNRLQELYNRIANEETTWDAVGAEADDIAEVQKEKERRSDHERRSFW